MTSKRLTKAYELFENNKPRKALKACNKVLISQPDNCEALVIKGSCLMALFEFEKALKCFDDALAIDHTLVDVWFNKSEIFIQMFEFEEAYNCGVDILKIDPTNADAWFLKGRTNYLMLLLDDASVCLDECLKLDSNHYKALGYKGLILNDKDEFDEGRAYLEKAFSIKPDDEDILMGLAMNHHRSKNHEKALEYANKLFAVAPRHYSAFYVSIFSLLGLERLDECIEMLGKALKYFPEDECFLELLDVLLSQINEYI